MFFRRDPLDSRLFKWQDSTPYTVRDLVKSVAIFGQTGSGKSSGSNLMIARAVLGMKGSGGLILGSKPEDRPWWQERFKEAGRQDDLLIFAPDQPHRCNFVDCLLKWGEDALGLTQFITTTGEFLDADAQKGERFWSQGTRRQIYNATVPIMQAGETLSVPNLQLFIATAAYSQQQADNVKWQGMFHNRVLTAAHHAQKDSIQAGDYAQSKDYWTNEFMHMDDKPRSSITAGTTNILHCCNTGLARELISGKTNLSPEVMEKGKWILVDMPVDRYGDTGRVIMHGFKLLCQKYILLRHVKPGDPVIVIHCDEAQDVVNSNDGPFLAKCRSHLGCMIFLTQSLHSYTCHMKDAAAKSLLTNFGHTIAHTIGDPETAKYLSDMMGEREDTKVNVSPRSKPDEPPADCSLHTAWQPVLQPNAFMHGLRAGGKSNRNCVDGIVLRSGARFRSGQNFIYQVFKQG